MSQVQVKEFQFVPKSLWSIYKVKTNIDADIIEHTKLLVRTTYYTCAVIAASNFATSSGLAAPPFFP